VQEYKLLAEFLWRDNKEMIIGEPSKKCC